MFSDTDRGILIRTQRVNRKGATIRAWGYTRLHKRHEEKEHWFMTGDSNRRVGNKAVTFILMITVDDTLREEECDTTM